VQADNAHPPNNRLYDKDSSQPDSAVVKFVGEFDARYRFIRNNGAFFCFKTDLDAARIRLIAIDIRKRERSNWKMIVPQTADTMSKQACRCTCPSLPRTHVVRHVKRPVSLITEVMPLELFCSLSGRRVR
jgi:Prolyl oligopeptidase, N-terminal beta-propeller domain